MASALTRKFVISLGRVTPMGDPRRAEGQGQLTHLISSGMEPRRNREHGGGNRRQDPPGLKRRIRVNELLGQDTGSTASGASSLDKVGERVDRKSN
jgi:hypothetical protein